MHIIKPGTRIDFIGKQKPAFMGSVVLVIACFAAIGILGMNFGVDFQGGSEIILHFNSTVETSAVRDAATKVGFEKADVQALRRRR